jgi:hypothetical protein
MNVLQLAVKLLPHCGARTKTIGSQRHSVKTQRLQAADEVQGGKVSGRIEAESTFTAWGRCEQPISLVEANGVDAYSHSF